MSREAKIIPFKLKRSLEKPPVQLSEIPPHVLERQKRLADTRAAYNSFDPEEQEQVGVLIFGPKPTNLKSV